MTSDHFPEPLRAYVFDSVFEPNVGLMLIVRIFNGCIYPGRNLKVSSDHGYFFDVKEVGIFQPNKISKDILFEGEVGYVLTNIKEPLIGINGLGETLLSLHYGVPALKKPLRNKPIVFASLFPELPDYFDDFIKAIQKLALEDPALTLEPENSGCLGSGLRCGFLGELHLEIIRQRLLDEYSVKTVCTPPSVTFRIQIHGKEPVDIRHPSELNELTNSSVGYEIWEPWTTVEIICRLEDVSSVHSLLEEKRGKVLETSALSSLQIRLICDVPLAELIEEFNSQLKTCTRGYGSFSFEIKDYRKSDIVLLKLTLMDDDVDAFQFLVHKSKTHEVGKRICEAFKDNLEPHQFTVIIRAVVGKRVVAKSEIRALRKDVIAKCYGGDYSRKKKLLVRQKEGKLRMREFGKVHMDSLALNKVFKSISK